MLNFKALSKIAIVWLLCRATEIAVFYLGVIFLGSTIAGKSFPIVIGENIFGPLFLYLAYSIMTFYIFGSMLATYFLSHRGRAAYLVSVTTIYVVLSSIFSVIVWRLDVLPIIIIVGAGSVGVFVANFIGSSVPRFSNR